MRKLPQLKGKIKLDLGSADNVAKGFVGVDFKDYGQEIIWDLRKGIPFPDSSVDEIYSCHLLEHFDEDETVDLFREIYRTLKMGATFMCRVPYATAPTAYYMGHKSFWNEMRVEVFDRDKSGYIGKFALLLNERRGNELFFKIKKI